MGQAGDTAYCLVQIINDIRIGIANGRNFNLRRLRPAAEVCPAHKFEANNTNPHTLSFP
jgi:hypothetical protein